jgi:hypothetical protein
MGVDEILLLWIPKLPGGIEVIILLEGGKTAVEFIFGVKLGIARSDVVPPL